MNTADLSNVVLIAVFVLCGLTSIFAIVSLMLETEAAKRVFAWAKGAMLTGAGLAVILLILLTKGFLTDDFAIAAVGQYSAANMPFFYKLSAVWAGSAGSFVLWMAFMFAAFAIWVITTDVKNLKFAAAGLAIGAVICTGFSAMLIFSAKPFAASTGTITDGVGLNPLLRNFWMIIHPPLLFVGFSAFLMPFVIVLSGVFTGIDFSEIRIILKRWLLFAILFLSLGIGTGAKWSYVVLGWGGYWSWDPVENASLLPWLISLAALHSIVRAKNKGISIGTAGLIPLPLILCFTATYVTRSGILASVHAFGDNKTFFILQSIIIVCILLWLAGVIYSLKLKTESSKLTVIFWANAILIFSAVAVGAGTFWPVIQRIFIAQGQGTITLTRDYYDRIISVSALFLSGLLIFSEIIRTKRRIFRKGGLDFGFKIGNPGLGGYIAHLGFLLLVLACWISSNEQVIDARLARGEKTVFGGYSITYKSFERTISKDAVKVGPEIEIEKGGFKKTMRPQNVIYTDGKKVSEAAVCSGLAEDVYILFDNVGWDGKVALEVKVKPFMMWLWAGMILVTLGAAMAIFERKKGEIDYEPGRTET